MATKSRSSIPVPLQRQLWSESGQQCAYCHGRESLDIHHIEPWAKVRKHEFSNLILLCGTCHGEADASRISTQQLQAIKSQLGRRREVLGVITPIDAPSITQTSSGIGATNIVAHTVNMKSSKGRRSAAVRIEGTVCDDPRKVGYLQHMAHRFNYLKAWDTPNMKYAMIHAAYRRETGYAVKTTPMDRFTDGVTYLQQRIRDTKLGRIFAARGNRLFASFEEFVLGKSDPKEGIPS